jgi:UDP-N-acetyl-D-mannosaminuronate dehydrogenase
MRSGIAFVGFDYVGAAVADRGSAVTGIDGRQTIVGEINPGIPCVGMS